MSSNLPRRIPPDRNPNTLLPMGGETMAANRAPARERMVRAIGAAIRAGDIAALQAFASGEQYPGGYAVVEYIGSEIPVDVKLAFLERLRTDAQHGLRGLQEALGSIATPATTHTRNHRTRSPWAGTSRSLGSRASTAAPDPAQTAIIPRQRKPEHDALPLNSGNAGTAATAAQVPTFPAANSQQA